MGGKLNQTVILMEFHQCQTMQPIQLISVGTEVCPLGDLDLYFPFHLVSKNLNWARVD